MRLKKSAPDTIVRLRSGFGLALLLACLLTFAQTTVAGHDAIHFAHASSGLCDQLQHGGHFPALTSLPAFASPVPVCVAPSTLPVVSSSLQPDYPPFHSRAPPR